MKLTKKLVAVACALAITIMAFSSGHIALAESGQVIKITAKRYEYNPSIITLKKGVPVTLEFTSLDRLHGFNCPDLGIRTDILPGKVSRIQLVPKKSGTFPFQCDNFCGEGHENMTGSFIVTE
jgi:cytochrome c oxidase subunit 2